MQYRLLKEAALKELEDENDKTAVFYRGCSMEEATGMIHPFPIWLADNLEYAKEYCEDRKCAILKYVIDNDALRMAEDWDFEEIVEENGFDCGWDPYDPDKEVLRMANKKGYNCYWIRSSSEDILVLLDESAVISKTKIL